MVKKQVYKTLKELVKLYELIDLNPSCFRSSDIVHDDLNSAIFSLGYILYPDALCVLDIIELVKGGDVNG